MSTMLQPRFLRRMLTNSPPPPSRVLPVGISKYVHSPQLDKDGWSAVTTNPNDSSDNTHAPAALRLVTWNVDFMAPNAGARVSCILDHLQKVVLAGSDSSCILLQELKRDSFDEMLRSKWVREHYAVTPPSTESWGGERRYGIATLVSRNIRATNAQMAQFTHSTMGRTALFVDVEMSLPGDSGDSKDSDSESKELETRVVRIANTHLESLSEGEQERPLQLQIIADALREEGVTGGGLVGGDMNMIMPADQDIHVRAALQDACDDPSAVTWGFQPRKRYPARRLDRVFYVGDQLEVAPVEVIGKGLKVEGRGPRAQWASDHCGLMTTIRLRSES
ncbi:hypothetical protein L226DRAFT_537792 [Lentinus tigrinus ALCF2SS1-7]|uniref:Endonuclease/exonuclease/phosphatase domain-containing protein n=1 Tax=Lentinus tigrinus ALCF2SS1-6 TaxID=1328759 RepID=A0A5C2S0Q5_9APHY|nr:hypothetical protein L227DRAFT_578357 [Lentinus tigrinus ALCF2SS1-6]RPD71798.1 hypothetical protein L226DRAFT_537792 [Lentinus tigrinus ALCF2SS1-7]